MTSEENLKTTQKTCSSDVYSESNNIFCSSKKLRPVLDLVRGKNVNTALAILEVSPKKKASHIISKCINAAIANGTNNKNFLKENLFISEAFSTKGKTMKRMFPRAKGSSNIRYKHICHLYIGLKNQGGK